MASSAPRTSFLRPLIGVVLIVAILMLAKTVIVPLVLAIMLTFVLTPVVNAIQRCGLGRLPAVIATVILTGGLCGLVGWVLASQARHLAQELPTHRKEIDEKLAGLRTNRGGTFPRLEKMVREVINGQTEADTVRPKDVPKEPVVVAKPPEPSNFEQLISAAGPALEPLAQAGLVTVLVIFMLIQREDLRNRLIGLPGHGRLMGTTRVLVESAHRVSRFLLTQTLINVGFGTLFALGLLLIGVPYALLWGGLAVVLRFVPFIGSIIASVFPLILAFAVAPGWTQPVLVLVLVVVLELGTANVAEPLLIGHGTGVSPIALLVAAAFWTWVWGPIGLVLATPLTVCLVVLGQNFPPLRYFALLLGNAPALEPHIAYYQRLLAHDAHEARQIADKQAQECGLEHVCDDVLLPALTMARLDRKNTGLSVEDEAFVFQSTKDILAKLPDPVPPPSETSAKAATAVDADRRPGSPEDAAAGSETLRSATPGGEAHGVLVLGCPAHHEAEEISVLMLAQLLKADGCRVEPVSTRALPADVETRIEKEHPALVFIAILPPGGFPQARYLCKRLRKRFAKLPIVVGYWGSARNYDKVLVRLRAAGASYVTTTLLQTRSQIHALVNYPADPSRETAAQAVPATLIGSAARAEGAVSEAGG
jgi:predicted PurR-regulated permease PerM